MIVEERLTTYLHSLESADIPVLDEIEQEALADMVPIIRKETKSFLKVMLEIKRPVKILEIGTAVGFSAILMGKFSGGMSHYNNRKLRKKDSNCQSQFCQGRYGTENYAA